MCMCCHEAGAEARTHGGRRAICCVNGCARSRIGGKGNIWGRTRVTEIANKPVLCMCYDGCHHHLLCSQHLLVVVVAAADCGLGQLGQRPLDFLEHCYPLCLVPLQVVNGGDA